MQCDTLRCEAVTGADMRRQESGGYCHGTAYSPCRAMLALRPAQSHLSEGVTFHMSAEKREREGEGRKRV
jgi:hypothetical protein